MARYETEEQQVEAIKQFWKENGMVIVLGAVLGLGGLWGWRYYNSEQLEAQEQASAHYQQAVEALQSESDAAAARRFLDEHKDTDYAVLTAFHLSKQAIDSGDWQEAAKQLTLASEQASVPSIAAIAHVRLAKVQLQQGEYETALATLGSVTAAAFTAQVEELKGDVYHAQGALDKAKLAYETALDENSANSNLLQMKLDNLNAERA